MPGKLDTLTLAGFRDELERLHEKRSGRRPADPIMDRLSLGVELWNLLVRLERAADVDRVVAWQLLAPEEFAAVAMQQVFQFRQRCSTPPWGDYDEWCVA